MKKPVVRKLRCAVYTRKSSEEGLEQEFNSLDAQREACEAYIASQKPEGWLLVPDHYDDGGISGTTLDRAALQRVLADIEVFDRNDVTFVRVTQIVQHHHLNGQADTQHPALVRSVRTRGDWRT